MIQDALYLLFICLAAFGSLIALIIVLFRQWSDRMLERIGEMPPKILLETIQTLSALIGIFASFAPMADKRDWFYPVIAGGFCLFIGRVLLVIIDARLKGQAKRAKLAAAMQTRLLFAIRGLVKQKLDRVLSAVKRDLKRTSIQHVREALTPKPHLNDLLWRMVIALRNQLEHGMPDANVRVGVYVSQEGQMVPVHGVDFKNPGYNPFDSYRKHKPHYCLTSDVPPSEVVRCCKEKRTVIIPDCEKASRKGLFFYTHDEQRKYLRSMIVYYLGEVVNADGTQSEAVISADSDQPRVFQESLADILETIMQECGLRVRLEMGLQALLRE